MHSNAITSPYIGSSEYFYNYFKTLCEFAQALSMLRVHSAVQLLGSGAVCRATVAALGSLHRFSFLLKHPRSLWRESLWNLSILRAVFIPPHFLY